MHSEAEMSRVTDRLTDGQIDAANIGKNRLHLMHLMQPNNDSDFLNMRLKYPASGR